MLEQNNRSGITRFFNRLGVETDDWRVKLPFLFAVVIGIVFTIPMLMSDVEKIQQSTSSTAAISYLFLPFSGLKLFCLFAVIGYCFGIVFRAMALKQYRETTRSLLVLMAAILITISASVAFIVNCLQTHAYLEKVRLIYAATSSAKIDNEFANMKNGSYRGYQFSILGYYQIYIIQALAQSKYTSTFILDQLAHSGNFRLDERISSVQNKMGFSAARLIAMNDNVSIPTLMYLVENAGDYVIIDAASKAVKRKSNELAQKIYDICKKNKAGFTNTSSPFYCDSAISILNRMNDISEPVRSRSPRIINVEHYP